MLGISAHRLLPLSFALIAALVANGALHAPRAVANPTAIYVINDHVGAALTGESVSAFDANLTTGSGRTTINNAVPFATIELASGSQIPNTAAAASVAGSTYILPKTDGSVSATTLNGKGLVCTPLCDAATPQTPDATDSYALWKVTDAGTHSASDLFTVTAVQDSVAVDSKANTVVGQAHDMAVSILSNQTTVQAGATTCTPTQATSPTTARALVFYTDINGNKLVGYMPTLTTSSSSALAIGSTGTFPQVSSGALVSMVNGDSNVGAEDAVCGNTASTTSATVTTTSTAGEIAGVSGSVTRTTQITVTGVPASVALTAVPTSVPCDGAHTSTVTAKVTDSAANNVVDGTPVSFNVVSQGTANPINTTTAGGLVSSIITPLSASAGGVSVQVTAGSAHASIFVSCIASSAATMVLTTTPTMIVCNGAGTSTVSADVRDAQGIHVADGTPVSFNVYAGGISSPIQTTTSGGHASSVVTPFSGIVGGVTVIVQSGSVLNSIGVLCDPSFDSDGDGCPDVREVGPDWHTGGERSPTDPWDFFDVPTPALLPSLTTGIRTKTVTLGDVIAVLAYIGTSSANPSSANANGATYGSDLNHNGMQDGAEYDRSAGSLSNQPWRSGAPNGSVSLADALVALEQVGTNCG